MNIEYNKTVKVDELSNLIPTKQGATFAQLWQVFYYARLFKYICRKHYPMIKSAYSKICTDKNLKKLCKLGYFKNPNEKVYCATDKVLPILKEAGFNIDVLPQESTGNGDINELNNTDIFIQLLKQKHFYTLLFPNFGYLIPDALLVEYDEETLSYMLTFLEIEAKKPDWENYLEDKRNNYLRLSKDIKVYEYWKNIAPKLGFSIPEISDFKFSVTFYSSIQKKFRNGFEFKLNNPL